MDYTKDFNYITELGFIVEVVWNKSFTIVYYHLINDEYVTILYSEHTLKDFSYFIETCVEFFYVWYNHNNKILSFIENKSTIYELEEIVLGNITKRITRQININKLI